MTKRTNVRQPIVESGEKLDEIKQTRRHIGPKKKLDLSVYNDQYPDMQLFWINDKDGEVQTWLDAGAELISAQIEGRKTYAGFNDKVSTEWVMRPVGESHGGVTLFAYALKMDPQLYKEFKYDPESQRRADIQAAMASDKSGESGALPGGNSVSTYQANLPTGPGVGYNQVRAK